MNKRGKRLFRRYFSTKGRATQKEYRSFIFFVSIVGTVVAVLGGLVGASYGTAEVLEETMWPGVSTLILMIFYGLIGAIEFSLYAVFFYSLIMIYPFYCICVRRRRDKSLVNSTTDVLLDGSNVSFVENVEAKAHSSVKQHTDGKVILIVVVSFLVLMPLFTIMNNQTDPVPTGVAVDLTSGTWTCGVDIEPGRYTATPVEADESGDIVVDCSRNMYATLGDSQGAVSSLTFTIEEGDTIEISDLSAVHFEPYEEGEDLSRATPVPVNLTTGTWTCGVDIAPGMYTATPLEDNETGEFAVDGSTDVYEELGSESDAVPSVTFTIEEGDTIEISYMSAVHFEPVQ